MIEGELALDLVQYEDRIATFEASLPPMLQGPRPTITVHLPFRDWDALGRPSVVNTRFTIEAP